MRDHKVLSNWCLISDLSFFQLVLVKTFAENQHWVFTE